MSNNKKISLNTNNTIQTKNILYSWLNNINPQFFLSIQLPKHLRSTKLSKSNQNLKKIMLNFERLSLKRHWNHNHIPFIAFSEQGKSLHWHYHIYIYNCSFSYLKMQLIINDLLTKLNLPKETLHIEPILTPGVYQYTSKEIITDINYHFDSDRIITSEFLFNIPHKTTEHTPEPQKHTQNTQK